MLCNRPETKWQHEQIFPFLTLLPGFPGDPVGPWSPLGPLKNTQNSVMKESTKWQMKRKKKSNIITSKRLPTALFLCKVTLKVQYFFLTISWKRLCSQAHMFFTLESAILLRTSVYPPQHILHSITYKQYIEKEQANCFDSFKVCGGCTCGLQGRENLWIPLKHLGLLVLQHFEVFNLIWT